MAWTESHQSLLDHRKTLRFARELGIDQVTAIGHLHIFWWWALDNAPDGVLTRINPEDIASTARFLNSSHDSTAFLEALISAGFVDRKFHGKGRPPTLRIHDWEEYGGKLLQARASHREVVRRSRDRPEEIRGDNSRGEESRSTPLKPPQGGAGRRRRKKDDGSPLSGRHRERVKH